MRCCPLRTPGCNKSAEPLLRPSSLSWRHAFGLSGIKDNARAAAAATIRRFGNVVAWAAGSAGSLGAVKVGLAPAAPAARAAASAGAKDATEALARRIDPSKKRDYETAKDLASEVLAKLTNEEQVTRVVVLIDDVDRADPPEVRAMLKLVRLIGDLPNVSDVLAMDDDRVCA